jgi:hypothetical protein
VKKTVYAVAVLFVFSMISISSYAAIMDGLVAYYSFDAGTPKDNSGNGNSGVLEGDPKPAAGKIGTCLDFDGDGDGVTVADNASLQLPDSLTLACWIFARTGVDHGAVAWKGEMIGWGANFNYRIATTGDGLTWGTTSGGENYFATGGVLKTNEWMFVAMTADGTNEIGYISSDGVNFEIPASDQGNPKDGGAPYNVWAGQPFRIGWAQGMGGDLASLTFFDGLIDEVALYDRALSEDELRELAGGLLSLTAVAPAGKLIKTWAAIKAD